MFSYLMTYFTLEAKQATKPAATTAPEQQQQQQVKLWPSKDAGKDIQNLGWERDTETETENETRTETGGAS